MTVIHCKGHEFEELQDVHQPDPNKPAVGQPVWFCINCDLKVKRKGAVEFLTGKTC